jgi:O-antigen/teichoic acid export membrane protein
LGQLPASARLPEESGGISVHDLKGRTVRGGLAKICSQGATMVLRMISLMVLARLLTPKDFGLVGMVTVATGVFGLLKDAGLSTATVQRPTITHSQISTLFWINMAVGGFLCAVSIGIAPVLVAFYQEPRLFWVSIALAIGFPVNAAGVQHSALLQRQMRFTTIAAIEGGAQLASVVVGIVLALSGWSYWALVAMALTLPGASTLAFWLSTGWIPGLPVRRSNVAGMLRFGSTITLNSVIMYVAYNVDKVLLGRFLGAETLGVYGRAYQLINIPTDSTNYSVGGVALSALSRLQHDTDRFKSYFLRAYSLVVAFTVPVTIACALFADDIVVVLLGAKWKDAGPIFRIMAPTILSFALINPLSWLMVSSGRIRRSLNMAMVIAPLVVLAYSIGLAFGAQGVAVGYSAMMAALTVPIILWATHGLPVTAKDILRAVAPPFISSLVATAISVAIAYSLAGALSPLLRLLLEGSVLLASYVGMLLYGMRQKAAYVDLIRALQTRPPVPVEGAAI